MKPRSAPAPVLSYNRLKQLNEEAIIMRLRAAGLKPGYLQKLGVRVSLGFTFCEAERRRDPDGVLCGAVKLILDAMVKGKFLHCDRHHCVEGFDQVRFRFPDTPVPEGLDLYRTWQNPGVELHISFEGVQLGGANLWLPGILPDLNTLLAARERGTRRMVWRKARDGGQA